MFGWFRPRLGMGVLGGLLAAWAFQAGCSSPAHPAALHQGDGGAGGSAGSGTGASGGSAASGGIVLDTGLDAPPPPDAAGFCGNTFIPVQLERTNVYVILDRSGSMLWPIAGTTETRFHAALTAIDLMLMKIGHRVRFGAAVFPSTAESCSTGLEVFSTRDGDSTPGVQGPVLTSLMITLEQYSPSNGGTPTAATLTALKSTVTGLTGKTVAILATDGAPNCNLAAVCDAAHCQDNIDANGACSPLTPNCCVPPFGQTGCVDDGPTTLAIADLAAAGVKTYVVGMPGTTATGADVYGAVLDAMAVAGGTARATTPKYYPTTSSVALTDTLRKIGLDVAVSCDVTLTEAPPNEKLVAVYFDQARVKKDDVNGWAWTSSTTIQLRGDACTQLKSGDVSTVQIVADCPISSN